MTTGNKVNRGWLSSLSLCVMLASASVTSNAATRIELDWQSPLSEDHPLVGTIHANRLPISFEDLVQQMASARHILIGEKHDNHDHQQLEVRLLKALNEHNAEHGKTMAVVFEMLDASQQKNIDAMTTALADNADLELSMEQMKADLDWPEQGWTWEDYDNVIGWVLDNRVPMYAGNIDSTQMQSVYRNGIDTEFTTAIELREELEQPLLEQVYQGHCELMEKELLSPMVDIQLVKDAAMTNALLEADTDMSVLVAGTGHTRIDSAIPRHLQLGGDDTVMSVALVEVDPELSSVTDYGVADRFDVLIFTPVANQRDYCADLEKSMEKH
ncbi:ChaN family lipoprotein [Granulosicoccus sp.]|nr:ChaN family lipoprotein [Granulosicoccus sp.]